MGDRFYIQQAAHKPGRRLKKDVVAELQTVLGSSISGLDRLTIKTLDELTEAIQHRLKTSKLTDNYGRMTHE